MRVTSNTFPETLIGHLQRLEREQVRLHDQLSTGQRVRAPSDNPVVMGEVKELESTQRQMVSYRRNLDRAMFLNDFTTQHTNYIGSLTKESLQTAQLYSTTVAEPATMAGYATLINNMLEQVFDTANAKNGNEYIFSGTTLLTQPFEASRDQQGRIASNASVTMRVGGTPPTLAVGTTYRIDNALGVDFTAGGAPNNNIGTTFVYNGGALNWGAGGPAALTALAPTITEANQNELILGRAYQIAGNGGNFLNSGASANANGTQFIYNGKLPAAWNGAELIPLEIDYENPMTSGTPVAGNLYFVGELQYGGESVEILPVPSAPPFYTDMVPTDLTGAGAPSGIEAGQFFVANGGAPQWGDGTGHGTGTLFGLKRQEMAVQYVGSDERPEYYVAKDTILSPYSSPNDHRPFAELMNNLVRVREAYEQAANAQTSIDAVVARQRLKDALASLQVSDDKVILAQSNQSIAKMNIQVAETRDTNTYKGIEDRIGRSVDIDTAEVISRLNQNQTAYQAALASGARLLSQSLLDYI